MLKTKKHSKPKLNFINSIVAFLLIIFIAAILRLSFLDQIPRGLNWDEVSYAYNAYSLKLTGKDEWGVSRPFFLKAFGDYKPALLSYLQVVSFYIFGYTTFAVRAPVAVLSVISIVAAGWFVYKLSRDRWLAILSILILTISPWHIHYSRIAMDPMVGFSFLMLGVALYVSKKPLIVATGIFFLLLSMYTYNAERLLVPLVACLYLTSCVIKDFFILKQRSLIGLLRRNIFGILLAGLSVVFAGYLFFFSPAGSRAADVMAFDINETTEKVEELYFRSSVVGLPNLRLLNNKLVVLANDFLRGYLIHFSTDFLFFDGNISPRHAFSKYGNLLLIFGPLFFFGIVRTIRQKSSISQLMLVWLLLSPLPAALTNDIPHSGRTLHMILPISFFVANGIFYLVQLTKVPFAKILISVFVLFAVAFNATLYWRDYLLFFPEESEFAFQGYAKQLSYFIKDQLQKDPNKNIYVTDSPTNPAIFFGWYLLIDPIEWQHATDSHRQIGKISIIELSEMKSGCLLKEENALIVADNKTIAEQLVVADDHIYTEDRFSDPSEIFDIYSTSELSSPNWSAIDDGCREQN